MSKGKNTNQELIILMNVKNKKYISIKSNKSDLYINNDIKMLFAIK